MTIRLRGAWNNSAELIKGHSYTCGYCGLHAGPSSRYRCDTFSENKKFATASIFICPSCNKPTYKTTDGKNQVPGPAIGDDVEFLPEDIHQLYNEARNCISVNAYTSAVLSCRKLLMNVSVSKGAESGKSFAFYVTFLSENNFVPPDSGEWVDHIRTKGNEATHEIPSISSDDAVELIDFTEMLLRFVYEMPGRMSKYKIK